MSDAQHLNTLYYHTLEIDKIFSVDAMGNNGNKIELQEGLFVLL